MQKYTLKTEQVNSNRLLKEVTDFVEEIITNFDIIWTSDVQRDAILEVIDEHMEDLVENNEIDQWNVICDSRNNKKSDVQSKRTHLDITYCQRNCYNITKLHYVVKKS